VTSSSDPPDGYFARKSTSEVSTYRGSLRTVTDILMGLRVS
jgi:hypothetical protein